MPPPPLAMSTPPRDCRRHRRRLLIPNVRDSIPPSLMEVDDDEDEQGEDVLASSTTTTTTTTTKNDPNSPTPTTPTVTTSNNNNSCWNDGSCYTIRTMHRKRNRCCCDYSNWMLRLFGRTTRLLYHCCFRKTLQSYVKYIRSSTNNQDNGLKFLQYTLWLASKLLYKKDSHGQDGLSKLSLELSMARCAIRLLEFPIALEAVIQNHNKMTTTTTKTTTSENQDHNTSTTTTTRLLQQCLDNFFAWSLCWYYPTEHMAYLHTIAPQWLAQGRSAQLWGTWSCRGWLVCTLVELIQGMLQWKKLLHQQHHHQQEQQLQLQQQQQEQHKQHQGQQQQQQQQEEQQQQQQEQEQHKEEEEEEAITKEEQLEQVKLQMVRNILFVLPAIHCSLPNNDRNPWLPSNVVNFLLWLESVVCLYQSLNNNTSSSSSS